VTCDVYARAGTVALPGAAAGVPVWNFAPDTSTALTGAGPVLVAGVGDAVTVTLHNVDVPTAVSLAFPGQAGLPDDTTGKPAGETASYSFTAKRPGTYLYEAGHTPNGARAAAMGLTGALVVRPTTWYDSPQVVNDLGAVTAPASGFDDEAVLVLSDLDPAFNAAPLTYDLRSFRSVYRLINGKAYPSTDQIPTGLNRKVLLRYLNAGMARHAMTVQGLRQQVVATNGFAADGAALVADSLAPGQTEDVIVSVGAEGSYPVTDASGSLDTAGQLSGTTNRLAFGGMMTLLGTNVTAPVDDTVGPKSSITAVTPNPAKATAPVTVTASFTDPTVGGVTGHSIQAAELLIDKQVSTVGVGTSTLPLTLTSTGATTATGTVTVPTSVLTTLTQGKHRLYVRAQDSAGTGNWGQVTSGVLDLAVTGAATSSLALKPNPSNGAAGAGSPTGDVTLTGTGDDTGLGGTVDQARYAIDCDPSTSTTCSFTAVSLASPGAATSALTGVLPAAVVSVLTDGIHQVFVQTHDSFGLWGPSAEVDLVVDKVGPTIGLGSGAVTPDPTDGTLGDPANSSSLKVSGSFTDPVVPGVGKGSVIAAAEGFLQKVDAAGAPIATCGAGDCANGTGFTFVANDGAWNSATEKAYGLIPLSELRGRQDGSYQVYVHARDAAGNWGSLATLSFTLRRTLFSDGFESGNVAAWTGGTVGAAARFSVGAAAASAGANGLAVTGSGTLEATLGAPAISPAATGYHARFAFRPNTLRTGTGQVGILTGIQTGTTRPLQIQYRRAAATNAAAQVRLEVLRSNGTTATTAWVTLPATSFSSLQVDWTASTRATVTLTVNGAATSLTSQNTSGRTVGSVRLGLANASAPVTGAGHFDAFVSSLNPLP
jgi:hypothetical protein